MNKVIISRLLLAVFLPCFLSGLPIELLAQDDPPSTIPCKPALSKGEAEIQEECTLIWDLKFYDRATETWLAGLEEQACLASRANVVAKACDKVPSNVGLHCFPDGNPFPVPCQAASKLTFESERYDDFMEKCEEYHLRIGTMGAYRWCFAAWYNDSQLEVKFVCGNAYAISGDIQRCARLVENQNTRE